MADCFCVVKHKMMWIVIGKMFTNQSFTENKAVINVKTVQICCSISQPRLKIKKNPFDADDELLFEF